MTWLAPSGNWVADWAACGWGTFWEVTVNSELVVKYFLLPLITFFQKNISLMFSDFALFLSYVVWLYLPILLLNSLLIFKFLRTFLLSVWILSLIILFLLCGCHFFLNHSLIIPILRLGLLFKSFSIIISGFSVSSGVMFCHIFILVILLHVGRCPPCLYTPLLHGQHVSDLTGEIGKNKLGVLSWAQALSS